MYSYKDFERLFVRYKVEGIPLGVSLQSFCTSHNVPYNLFAKWYYDRVLSVIHQQLNRELENVGV